MSYTKNQLYIVDADSWIAAHEERYPPDVFARLWSKLAEAAHDEIVRTPRQAINETGNGTKGVAAWLKMQPKIVLRETPGVVSRMNEIRDRFPSLTRGIEESADPWLVAHARGMTGAVVVSEEQPSMGRTPKIPDVCRAFDVKCIRLLEMFRRLRIRWE